MNALVYMVYVWMLIYACVDSCIASYVLLYVACVHACMCGRCALCVCIRVRLCVCMIVIARVLDACMYMCVWQRMYGCHI